MVWYSSYECQGDRKYKCYYINERTGETWCVDNSSSCPSWDDGGVLYNVGSGSGGGGGW
jgi:hypothetical protein